MIRYCLWPAILGIIASAALSAPTGLPIPPSIIKEVETGKPSTPSAAQAQQQRIDALQKAAMGEDWDAGMAAIRELKSMGAPARPTLIGVVRQILSRDQRAIEQSIVAMGDTKIAGDYEREIQDLRKAARDNIPRLSKEKPETIKKAHEYYEKLVPMTAKMNQAWGLRMTIAQGMARRGELISIWRAIAPPGEKEFTSASETALRDKASRAVGDFLDRVAGLQWGKEPSDPSLKPVWFFGMCRKIEAYNNSIMPQFMEPEEIRNLVAVNTYREAIGLLPYEADPRLVQAARRHSKEMVEKKYFSHESPTPSEKTFGDRCRNAGYKHGSGENIAMGPTSGDKAFWMWFDSPGHHHNMAGGSSALGVGRWGNHHTQNFGAGPRVMLMGPEDRDKQKVAGDVIAPDGKKS